MAKSDWILCFAYLAFACFIGGGAVGFFNYHELIKGQPKMIEKYLNINQIPDRRNHVPSKTPMPPSPQPPK